MNWCFLSHMKETDTIVFLKPWKAALKPGSQLVRQYILVQYLANFFTFTKVSSTSVSLQLWTRSWKVVLTRVSLYLLATSLKAHFLLSSFFKQSAQICYVLDCLQEQTSTTVMTDYTGFSKQRYPASRSGLPLRTIRMINFEISEVCSFFIWKACNPLIIYCTLSRTKRI